MKKTLLIALGIFSVIAFIFYLNAKEDSARSVVKSRDRDFKISLKSIATVNHEYSSTEILVDGDYIYLKDFKKQQIIKIDRKGIEQARYGAKGEGPKENLMIRGFSIDNIGIRTIDGRKNTISKVSFGDSLIYTFKPDFTISTGGFIANEGVILKGARGPHSNRQIDFNLFKNGKSSKINVTKIFPTKKSSDWIYDGSFISTRDGGCLYATYFSNKFIKFDSVGNIQYSKSYLYSVPEIVLKEEGGGIFPVENDKPNMYSMTSNDKYIFFQTSVGDDKKPGQMIIDVYAISNGNYVTSIAIKEDPKEGFPEHIKTFGDQLILFYQSKFQIYDLVE